MAFDADQLSAARRRRRTRARFEARPRAPARDAVGGQPADQGARAAGGPACWCSGARPCRPDRRPARCWSASPGRSALLARRDGRCVPAPAARGRRPPRLARRRQRRLAVHVVPGGGRRTCPPTSCVDLRREDQDHSADLLRDGTVMAAVTADPRAVQGCRVRPLGAMRYLAGRGAVDRRDRWFADGLGAEAFAAAPLLAFNRKDGAAGTLRRAGRRPAHGDRRPCTTCRRSRRSSGSSSAGPRAGGWCPRSPRASAIAAGALVEIRPGRHLDVPLYWQHWALRTPTLDDLTDRVVAAARRAATGAAPAPAACRRGRRAAF